MSESFNEQDTEVKRSVGRPPKNQTEQVAVKKGKPTWKPADAVDIQDKDPNYTYRIIEKSPRNIDKKRREGWEILSGINAQGESLQRGYGRIDDGKPLTSSLEGHDYVIGRIPNELAEARREYVQQKTDRMERALMSNTKKDMAKATGGAGSIHGSIMMEKRGVRTVIEE